MKGLENLSAQDIVAIASAGVSALALVVFMLVLSSDKAPSRAATRIIIIGLVLTTLTQLATIFKDAIVFARSRISVSLTPDVSSIAQFLPAESGAPLLARAYLWTDGGAPECNPNAPQFDSGAKACLVFAQEFELGKLKEAIHVSVDPVLRELRDRVLKVTSVNTAIVAEHSVGSCPTSPKTSLTVADDVASARE